MMRINARPSFLVQNMIDYFYNGEYIGCTHWISGYFERSRMLNEFIKKHNLQTKY